MKILFATDGSAHSHYAIREGLRVLNTEGAEVYVVSVADVLTPMGPFDLAAPSTASTLLLDAELKNAEADLASAAALLAEFGLRATPLERQGDAATEILAVATHVKPDVIVMGAHHRNGLERLLLGSVSDAVSHHWHGAVLVIHPQA